MPGLRIFNNYRRKDSDGYAGRPFDHLSARYPKRVFMDVDGIHARSGFLHDLEKSQQSDVVNALIGRGTNMRMVLRKMTICMLFILLTGNPLSALAQSFIVSTVAGNGGNGYSGDGGPAINAHLTSPVGVAVDASGSLYIADAANDRIRKVSPNGVVTTVAGNGIAAYSGDGGPAPNAAIQIAFGNGSSGLAVDGQGNLYIADTLNSRVRKVSTAGVITTIAGNGGGGYSGDGGPATSAQIGIPNGLAVDPAGNLYIAEYDDFDCAVRKVAPSGIITTVAGTSNCGYSGDNGPATSALLYRPEGLTLDSSGNLYIADTGNQRIRKVALNGLITTVAGTGNARYDGDGGPATSFSLNEPIGVAVDDLSNLYIADSDNYRIREVSFSGTISTIAGTGDYGFAGDGAPATSAELTQVDGLAIDSTGNLYFSDPENNRVRRLTPTSAGGYTSAPLVASVVNASGGERAIAPNTWITITGSGLSPDTRIWQAYDFLNERMPTSLDGVSVTMNGANAYVYYISPNQLNVLTPPGLGEGQAQVKVSNNGNLTAPFAVNVQQVSPAFFTFDGTQVAATHADGSLVGPTSLYPGQSTPAKPNETISVYANGFGVTSAAVVNGAESQSGSLPSPPAVTIGGIAVSVQFAGLVSPGTYQFNVIVPSSAPVGDDALTATYGGFTTQAGVQIAVGSGSGTGDDVRTLSAVNPNSGAAGKTLTVVITGVNTNFVQGQTLVSFGSDTSVGGAPFGQAGTVTVVSPTSAVPR